MRLGRNRGHRDIVREVYEDNRRTLGLDTAPPRQEIRRGSGVVALLAVLIVLFGGADEEGKLEASTPADVFVTADEQVLQSFGSPEDPGVRSANPPLAEVYGLGVRTIVLDPGHGGRDAGATGPSGLTEKAVALDVAKRLERQLKEQGLLVHLTRTKDIGVSLRQRAEFAADRNADLFVSIHVNALPVKSITSVETYYFSPRGAADIELLARRENFDSGYTLAQWERGLSSLGQTVKVGESRELAQHVQAALFANVRRINPDVRDWGIKSGPFMVLWDVDVPAILAEISVLSMPEEESRLRSDVYREQLASALATGILSYLGRHSLTAIAE